MKTDLKQAIRNKHNAQSLSAAQLEAMYARLNQPTPGNETPAKRHHWLMAASVAMVALFAMTLVLFMPGKVTDMPQQIAAEVVRNHLKLKPLEVSTDSIETIRAHFDKLSFVPITSLNIDDSSILLGGRYCSIQGYTAAQLRMVNPESGSLDTLYQAPYIKEVYGKLPDIGKQKTPLAVYERGIKVSIWVEKGILFARTHVDEIK